MGRVNGAVERGAAGAKIQEFAVWTLDDNSETATALRQGVTRKGEEERGRARTREACGRWTVDGGRARRQECRRAPGADVPILCWGGVGEVVGRCTLNGSRTQEEGGMGANSGQTAAEGYWEQRSDVFLR